MKISVIIPVYNEEKHIEECIQSILKNERTPDEILVADGGSSDHTIDIVSQYPSIILLNNLERTAAAGRNVALSRSTGDIIAFTDGDCIARRNWLYEIERAFRTQPIDGLGGKVETAPFENKYEEYWGTLAWKKIMNFGNESYIVSKRTLNDAFVTANCAYRRDLLEQLNGFDTWFGNHAEDVDLCWRALKRGANLLYEPAAVIEAHSVTTIKGIRQKSFRNGVSSSKLQKRYGEPINYDWGIYKMWAENFVAFFHGVPDAGLNITELTWHLFGKYYGSIRYGVINI